MNLELTIQAMYDCYPELYKERSDCLNHLFCVLGSGWEWENGELVSKNKKYQELDAEKLESHLVDGKAHQHNVMSLLDVAVFYTMQGIVERMPEGDLSPEAYKLTKQALYEYYAKQGYPAGKLHKLPREKIWYFACANNWCDEYVPLFNIPDDIKPDWLEGIEECKAMIREDGFNLDDTSRKPVEYKNQEE